MFSYSSRDLESEMSQAKLKGPAGLHSFLVAQRGNSISLPLPASRLLLFPGPSIFKASNGRLNFSHMTSLQHSVSISHFLLSLRLSASFTHKEHLQLHWAHLDNPKHSPYFKVSWLATLTPFVTSIHPGHIAQHVPKSGAYCVGIFGGPLYLPQFLFYHLKVITFLPILIHINPNIVPTA